MGTFYQLLFLIPSPLIIFQVFQYFHKTLINYNNIIYDIPNIVTTEILAILNYNAQIFYRLFKPYYAIVFIIPYILYRNWVIGSSYIKHYQPKF
mmetsp:Transcript_34131/g.6153  ORF Transcript_34131/g.6153 Transcript_34131/m.6153 type:complete len:94 (+) Transcript_34131:94-375(+)